MASVLLRYLLTDPLLTPRQITDLFAHDIVQAATRATYVSNLPYIHSLEMLVAMAPEGILAVIGGNWQIFDQMIARSGATIHLNTSVTEIALDPTHDPLSPHAKYVISIQSEADAAEETHPIHFDEVVIAAPWQYSGIKASDEVLQRAIDEIPYVKLYVTLFTSPFVLSPGFFGLPPGSKAPTSILTTLGADEEPLPGRDGVGKSGFYSVHTLRVITNPETLREEYVYKILSPDPVSADLLSSLLGVKVPEASVSSSGGETTNMASPVSWYHSHAFHSYPVQLPRITFQDPILRSGLYYTSGIESFISSMEASSLMGMNVARLIADDLRAQRDGGPDSRGMAGLSSQMDEL